MQPGKRVALLKCNNIEHRYDIYICIRTYIYIYIYIRVCECHIVCTYRNVISRNIVLSTLTGKYLVILLLNNIFEVEFLILQCCDPIVVLAQHALQGFCVGRRWKKIGQNSSCFSLFLFCFFFLFLSKMMEKSMIDWIEEVCICYCKIHDRRAHGGRRRILWGRGKKKNLSVSSARGEKNEEVVVSREREREMREYNGKKCGSEKRKKFTTTVFAVIYRVIYGLLLSLIIGMSVEKKKRIKKKGIFL